MSGDVSAALDAGAIIAEVREIDSSKFVVVPEESKVIDLNEYLLEPPRKKGMVSLMDAESFIGYVNEEKTDSTRIYGNLAKRMFVAVFNDHGSEAGWKDYKAMYACPLSPEWETWSRSNGTKMTQEQFAQFIEDNLPDIATPPAADMLEISRTLEAKKKVNFASGIRLSNGQNELTYEEEIKGTAGKGKLTVPEEFTIGIPVLEGGERYAVKCRLRYRISDGGGLLMWYDLLRPHKIVEDAVMAVWTQIVENTSVTVYHGSP